MKVISLLLVIAINVCLVNGFDSFNLTKCEHGDAKCLIRLQQFFIDEFWNGNEELELLKLDPLLIKNATLTQQGTGAVNFNLQFKDCQFTGYRDSEVIDAVGFPADFDGTVAELSVKAPKFAIIGPYTINGSFLVLSIQGSGKTNITLYDLVAKMKFRLKKVIKDGEVYASAEKLKLDITPSRLYIHFEELFKEAPEINDYANNFLKENWKLVFEDIKPSAMKTFGKIWQDILNHIMGRIPYKEFFKQSKSVQ